MKVFIITDLEGATGVSGSWEDFNPGGRIHEEAKRMLTSDVNAAVEGLFRGGATEVVVLDGHGAAFSILLEDLDPRVKLIRGRRLSELEGLDSSFDAVVAIGAHAMAGTPSALLCHTLSHETIVNIWLNGKLVGEIGLWAAIAGYYNVPMIMVAGDYAATEEAKKLLGDIEVVAVKRATSMYAAECIHPSVARELITSAAERALTRLRRGEFKPLKLEPPVELKVEYMLPTHVERIALRPGVVRVDGRTVLYRGKNILECMRAIL